jgi:putative salt-induced outer membrane protein YdiY
MGDDRMRVVMRSTIAAFVVALGAASVAAAQQTLALNNGDRLTGTLSGIEGSNWVFALASGELKIAASDVASFTATQAIGLRLADGSIVAATVGTVGSQLQLSLTDGTTRTVTPADLAAVGDPENLEALRPVDIGLFKPFSKFWGATVGFGFSNNSGNSKARGIAFSFDIDRKSPKDRQSIKGGLNRQLAPGADGELETTVEKYFGSVRLDVFLVSRLFTFGFAGWDRDQFQDIDLRQNYGLGFGYQVLETDKADLRFYGSGGVRLEKFTSGGDNSTSILGLGGGYRQSLGPIVFDWTVSYTPSLEDGADYRIVSDASFTTTIFEGLGFRIGSRNEYNNSPQPDVKKHDWLFTTALTYSIGR